MQDNIYSMLPFIKNKRRNKERYKSAYLHLREDKLERIWLPTGEETGRYGSDTPLGIAFYSFDFWIL